MVDQGPCKGSPWGRDHGLLMALGAGQEGTRFTEEGQGLRRGHSAHLRLRSRGLPAELQCM